MAAAKRSRSILIFFMLGVVFICLNINALAHEGPMGVNAVSEGKGPHGTSAEAVGATGLVNKRLDTNKVSGVIGGSTSKQISGPNGVVGTWSNNRKNQQETMDVITNNPDCGHLPEEIEDAGFVASTADYSTPRHHPPKNN